MNRRLIGLASLASSLALTVTLSGCHPLPPPTPLDQLTPQQTAGYAVFQRRCAICHYERVSKAKNGPSLAGIFKKTYLPSGAPADDDRVAATVLHGRGLMPPQSNTDPDELESLLAYLHTV
ncbi:MAG: c-type cytochrome [Janthinobacterium lividum]